MVRVEGLGNVARAETRRSTCRLLIALKAMIRPLRRRAAKKHSQKRPRRFMFGPTDRRNPNRKRSVAGASSLPAISFWAVKMVVLGNFIASFWAGAHVDVDANGRPEG